MQSSLQLVEVLLTDLPEVSALLDPNTGTERQRFVAIRDAWQAFSDDTNLLLVRPPQFPDTSTESTMPAFPNPSSAHTCSTMLL